MENILNGKYQFTNSVQTNAPVPKVSKYIAGSKQIEKSQDIFSTMIRVLQNLGFPRRFLNKILSYWL